MKNFVDKILAAFANYSAQMAAGTASFWNTYQLKEPQNISKR